MAVLSVLQIEASPICGPCDEDHILSLRASGWREQVARHIQRHPCDFWSSNHFQYAMEKLPFAIPSHLRWIAQDSNGAWWGYTAEPHRNDFGWYENEVGETVRLGQTEPVNWESSLTKTADLD